MQILWAIIRPLDTGSSAATTLEGPVTNGSSKNAALATRKVIVAIRALSDSLTISVSLYLYIWVRVRVPTYRLVVKEHPPSLFWLQGDPGKGMAMDTGGRRSCASGL